MTDIQLIKEKLDIAEVIRSYIEIKAVGNGYTSTCPFHSEKTPSFHINTNLQIYKCFGCGKGGDVISFIQEIERLDFKSALQLAAEKAGITLENVSSKNTEDLKTVQRAKEAYELATTFYSYILNTHTAGKIGREYAQKRNISGKELNLFRFGFAPDSNLSLLNYLTKKGFKTSELEEFGLIIKKQNSYIDKFRNRLMQPIKNINGNVVGFSGRYLGNFDKAPKYLNSPETVLFKKQDILYNLDLAKDSARKLDKLILMEGNLDIVSSFRAGTHNVVAPLGTAFTIHQAKLIKRYANTVLFAFDVDDAGFNATVKGIQIAEDLGLRHMVVDFESTGANDPDDLVRIDPQKWLDIVAEPTNSIDFCINHILKQIDINTVEGKQSFRDKITPIYLSIKDDILKNYAKEQISIYLGVSQEQIAIQSRTYKNVYETEKGNLHEEENIETEIATTMQEQFLSLLIQNISLLKNPNISKIEDEFFEDKAQMQLFQFLKSNAENAETNIKSESDLLQNLYTKLYLLDNSNIKDIPYLLNSLTKRIGENYLKNSLMTLRHNLKSNPEDESEIFAKISILTQKLNNFRKI